MALEGIDGSGKSTQARLLVDALRAAGIDVESTREPGGTALGERLRALLLDGQLEEICLAAEANLFAAARAELVERVVAPALAAGRWVVCDRFIDSSLAYQGAARGLGIDAVLALNAPGLSGHLPDRALVIDVPVGVAATRRRLRPDRIEREGDNLQRRVAEGYRELARRFPGRVRVVDGSGRPEDVHRAVLEELEPLR